MNYILQVLYLDKSQEEIDAVLRFISPVTTSVGKWIMFDNGTFLYHFSTELDILFLKEYFEEFTDTFSSAFILSPVTDNLTVKLPDDEVGYFFDLESTETEIIEIEDDFDFDDTTMEMIRKLSKKFEVRNSEMDLDEILEKIHQKGIESLSIQEESFLKHYNS